MHIEVQVALNFVISYLYNKLPRRRVNIFGEELEKALKDKFSGHWYPDKPCRGSAFRCLKTGGPLDPVLERAARESGVPVQDVLEHLPRDLAVWVDPGEVSYRIGEKGAVKVLFCSDERSIEERNSDREVTRTFNPEAQCFRPVDPIPDPSPMSTTFSSAPAFARTQPLTFTTATFAQTKFGSTKLKTNSKRANRMSPTEFSNYIKQRAMQQQLAAANRAMSPDPSSYFYGSSANVNHINGMNGFGRHNNLTPVGPRGSHMDGMPPHSPHSPSSPSEAPWPTSTGGPTYPHLLLAN